LGNCKYCGKPAGFLQSKHDDCEKQYQERERITQAGQQKIVDAVSHAIKESDNFDTLEKTISEIEKSSFIPSSDRKALLIRGWENSVEQFLEGGIVDREGETRLVEFQEHFALSQGELDVNGALTKTAKSAVLRDVLNGIVPHRMVIEGNMPVNVQKGEQIVWAFPGSKLLEDKTRREYEGRSQGVSLRVMKGVYYRLGAFKGHPVEHTERICVGTGVVVMTDKTFYFGGPQTSLRIPYTKIVSFIPFSDGIGIMRDVANVKPLIFVTGDGWFAYNLVINLAKM
jgi:hypothetical protein